MAAEVPEVALPPSRAPAARLRPIAVLALWGMAGGAGGWLLDYFFLQNLGGFGLSARVFAGLGIAISTAWLLDLRGTRLAALLILTPLLWAGMTLLLQYLLLQEEWVVRAAADLKLNWRAVESYLNAYFPILEWLLGGVWVGLAVGLATSPVSARSLGRLLLLGMAGALAGLLGSMLFGLVINLLFIVLNSQLQAPDGSFAAGAKTWLSAFKIANNSLLAGVQLYFVNLAILFALRKEKGK